MSLRGIELPVNSVIIIALAIFVLLMLSVFLTKGSSSLDQTQINTAFNQGCSQLSSYNCDYTRVSEIKTNLVINNQAKTLLDVCRMSFNDPSMSAFKCMKNCQVCPKRVSEGSYCEEESDCVTPLTPETDWICAQSIHQCQCGSTKCRNIIEGNPIL